MSYSYLFVFGRTPELAFLELQSFFPGATFVSPGVAHVETHQDFPALATIDKLGGTVKIAKALGTIDKLTADQLVAFLPTTASEVHFGVSMYGGSLPSSILSDLKKLLETKGIRGRYAISRHGETLSSVTVDKSHITELIVVKSREEYLVGITSVVQPYQEWGKRDYDRPHADAKAGMLPPKVARMLVNIARPVKDGVLLDPFCGMGTVLTEGYLVGWHVTGCDIAKDVVQKAHDNLRWVVRQNSSGTGIAGNIFISDAVHVSQTLSSKSVTAIVTEPFMGATSIANKSHVESTEVKNIIKGLEKLYIGCLRDWSKVLISGGVVVIALPGYAIGGRIYFVKKVIDMCENLGYTTLAGPIAYGRPQAVVTRNFYILRYGTR